MKVATFNINNVVRRLPNLLAWLRKTKPDVVCLQELKAEDAAFPAAALESVDTARAMWSEVVPGGSHWSWRMPRGSAIRFVALEAGANDVITDADGAIEVLCAAPEFEAVKKALEAAGLKPDMAEVTMRAENTVALTGDDAARMQKLLDILEDLDDVQDVFHNAEIDAP